jgi:hypothetical protein
MTNSGVLPTPSQQGITGGAWSWYDGTVPLNYQQPPSMGGSGVPMAGQDLAAAFYGVSAHIQFLSAGQRYQFNSTFSTAVGGYPVGAIVQVAAGAGYSAAEYINILASNANPPNDSTIGVSWILYSSGNNKYLDITTTAGALTGAVANVLTIDPISQACYQVIDLGSGGALTANQTVILPSYKGQYTLFNNTTGGYQVTIETATPGALVILQAGQSVMVFCDGTNCYAISKDTNPVGSIIQFAGASAPYGYLSCPTTATTVSRSTYAALFAAIGTTWGAGDGSTTFGIPYFPAGYAAIAGTPGSLSIGQMPAHTHSYNNVTTDGNQGSGGANTAHVVFAGTTGSTGSGTTNLAAGVQLLMCVKF